MVVGILALAALVSGCGEDSATSSSLTKAEFVKQANAACAKRHQTWQTALASYNQKVEERNAANKVQVQEEIATDLLEKEMIPAVSELVEALEALPAPEGDEAQVSKMVDTLSQELDKVESDKNVVYGLSKSHNFEGFEEEAKKYGLNCSFE
jgi:predicted secreted protein